MKKEVWIALLRVLEKVVALLLTLFLCFFLLVLAAGKKPDIRPAEAAVLGEKCP